MDIHSSTHRATAPSSMLRKHQPFSAGGRAVHVVFELRTVRALGCRGHDLPGIQEMARNRSLLHPCCVHCHHLSPPSPQRRIVPLLLIMSCLPPLSLLIVSLCLRRHSLHPASRSSPLAAIKFIRTHASFCIHELEFGPVS